MGGQCLSCKQDFHLCQYDFHHPEPSKKEGKPSEMAQRKDPRKFFAEAAKCILLCKNCHNYEHWLWPNGSTMFDDFEIESQLESQTETFQPYVEHGWDIED